MLVKFDGMGVWWGGSAGFGLRVFGVIAIMLVLKVE